MRRRASIVAALALVAGLGVTAVQPASAAAIIINVPASQPTIQAGIDAAIDGDTVVVAPGTYFEHIDFKGKAIEVRSSAGAQTTIIDGGGTGHVVLFKSGEGRLSVLKGFTVTHGAFPAQPVVLAGSGIGINQASPTITQNLVTGNGYGAFNGAGIGAIGGAPLIIDNFISENHAGPSSAGGGIFAGADAEITRNTVEGNTAGSGAGIHIYSGGAPFVHANFVKGNHATNGGGLFVDNSAGTYVNNVLVENVSDAAGGGAYLLGGSAVPYLLNNTVIRNQAGTGAGVAIGQGQATLVNNLIAGPPAQALVACGPGVTFPATFSHNDVYNGMASPYAGCADPTGSHGNISADPLLISEGPNYAPDDEGPTVDAGDNAAASLPATDLWGGARVTDGNGDGVAVVDIGATETAASTGRRYNPVTPTRVLDTRTGQGVSAGRLGPASTLSLRMTGIGLLPAQATAVVLNVTVTEPTALGFLTAWPAGTAKPLASNLNFVAGETVANLVTVKIGAGGMVNFYNLAGSVDVIADLAGWYGYGPTGASYTSLSPARILDTRAGVGAPMGPLPKESPMTLQVTGRGGVPASGVSAVVLNLTVTDTASGGWLAAWPAGEALPLVSNLNYVAGQTVPNLAIVKVGAGGAVNLYSSGGPVSVVADVAGYFGPDGGAGPGFSSVVPARILDTRVGNGAPTAPLAPGIPISLQVTGRGGVPAAGVSAVVLNVTVTQPASGGWLAAWPAGEALPLVSNLNFVAGETVPNLVMVKVGAGGKVNLYSSGGPVDVIADVAGWFRA